MQLQEFSNKMGTTFDSWYYTISPDQRVKVEQFCLSYPLNEIEENIFSAAEQNSIDIAIAPAIIFNTTVKNEERTLNCNFFPLVSVRDTKRAYIFNNNLKGLFKNAKSDYADKKIVFYCLLPLMINYDESNQLCFGIYGTFLIT